MFFGYNTKVVSFGLGLVLGALTLLAQADDCRRCEQYQPFVRLSMLGADVGDVSLLTLHPQTDPLAWSIERRQAVETSIKANALIPLECKEVLISRNRLRFTTVVQAGTSAPAVGFHFDAAGAWSVLWSYQALVNSQVSAACGNVPVETYAACVKRQGADAYKALSGSIDSRSARQLALAAADPANLFAPLAGLNTSQLTVLQIYNHVLGVQSSAELHKYLTSIRSRITTEQALELGALLGAIARHPGYDHDRMHASSPDSRGIVSTETILETAHGNTLAGANSDLQVNELIQHAGVCRDIHSVIGLVEKDLGVPHSVVVSFAQIDAYHVTWAGQDPKDALVVHQIDYGTQITTAGGSSRSLFQGPSDLSLTYRLALPGGRVIADIQSQQGLWLAGAAGFRPGDPFAQNEGALLATQAALGPNGHTRAIMAVGADGNGARYGVVGAGQSWNQTGPAPGQAAVLTGAQIREPGAFGNSDGKIYDIDFVYAQLEQKLRSKNFTITPKLRARFEAQLSLLGMVSVAQTEGSPGGFSSHAGQVNGQGDGHLSSGVVVNQGNSGDATRATYKGEVRLTGGIADIRNNEVPQLPIPVLDDVLLSADVRHRLAKSPTGQLYLVAAAKLALDELGQRGRTELGLATDHLAFTVGAEGRLTNSSATFEPGSARQVFGMFSWSPQPALNLGVTAYVPLEKGGGLSPRIMGTGIVTF